MRSSYRNANSAVFFQELSSFEVYLEPTARELMEALRSLFIQTHWHSFTILADESVVSSVLLRRELVTILEEPPLRPTIVRLPATKRPQALFRLVATTAMLSDLSTEFRTKLYNEAEELFSVVCYNNPRDKRLPVHFLKRIQQMIGEIVP